MTALIIALMPPMHVDAGMIVVVVVVEYFSKQIHTNSAMMFLHQKLDPVAERGRRISKWKRKTRSMFYRPR